jgi:hypothetical protein
MLLIPDLKVGAIKWDSSNVMISDKNVQECDATDDQ